MTNGQGCAPAPLSCGAGVQLPRPPFPSLCAGAGEGWRVGRGVDRDDQEGPGVQEAKAATSSPPGTADPAVPTVARTCVPAVCGADMASPMGKPQDTAVSLAGAHSCANTCAHWSPYARALTHTRTHTDTRAHAHTCCSTLYADACLYMFTNAHVRTMHTLTHRLTYSTCMHVLT